MNGPDFKYTLTGRSVFKIPWSYDEALWVTHGTHHLKISPKGCVEKDFTVARRVSLVGSQLVLQKGAGVCRERDYI